jgi:hypothetical protein
MTDVLRQARRADFEPLAGDGRAATRVTEGGAPRRPGHAPVGGEGLDGDIGAALVILSRRDYEAIRCAVELVDQLGEAHGFDPAELTSPRTQEPLGPFIERLRCAMRLFETFPPEDPSDRQGGVAATEPDRPASRRATEGVSVPQDPRAASDLR